MNFLKTGNNTIININLIEGIYIPEKSEDEIVFLMNSESRFKQRFETKEECQEAFTKLVANLTR